VTVGDTRADRDPHLLAFYARHPISAGHIIDKVKAARGHLDGVTAHDLWPHDQDHYGGLAANAKLAQRAGLKPGMRVADFCAGLGGPARWYAVTHDVDVTGIDITPERVKGAAELTALVGLADRVRVAEGSVTDVPLDDASMDAVVSQEALLHVPDKRAALAEAHRVLKPGGRLAFSDWVAPVPLAPDVAEDMWTGIAARTLQSGDGYVAWLEELGFSDVLVEDLTPEWAVVLAERQKMYAALMEEAKRAGAPAGDTAFAESYVRFVEHVKAGRLGGVRVSGVRG
jgi:ubiquinone/menaquinone biosynthesis C-methylase UbiE